jgi:NADH-quinone oxidoreductase E subunit
MRATSHRAGRAGDFAFTPETTAKAEQAMAKYPEGRQASAILALLDLAQRQNGGWLPGEAIEYVANLLKIAPIRVHEVASFYTMLNLKPVGRHLVQVCRTTPCWLCGSHGITKACLDALGIGLGETTADGLFTVVEVECLGACANAPMVQINDDYYEDLTPERMAEIIAELAAGRTVPPGSQTGRLGSCPADGPTTLLDSFGKDGQQAIEGEGSD